MSEINILKLRRRILGLLFLVIGFYTISQTAFILQVNLLHHFHRGYIGSFVPYHWYLFHSYILGIIPKLAPITVLLIGVIAPKRKMILVGLMSAIVVFNMILAAGPLSSDPISQMHPQGSTRFEGHVYYLVDFESEWGRAWEEQVLYQCDSLGLICSSEFSITDDDRKEILDRIQ